MPGAFDAWMPLLRDFGTLALADVAAYAIGYARDGFPATPGIVARSRARAALGLVGRALVPAPAAGARLRNPMLAATYERLARSAARPRGAHRRGARRLVPGLRGRGDRRGAAEPVIDSSGRRKPAC